MSRAGDANHAFAMSSYIRLHCVANYGRPARDVARELGLSHNAVIGHWKRARDNGQLPPLDRPARNPTAVQNYAAKLRRNGIKGAELRKAVSKFACSHPVITDETYEGQTC